MATSNDRLIQRKIRNGRRAKTPGWTTSQWLMAATAVGATAYLGYELLSYLLPSSAQVPLAGKETIAAVCEPRVIGMQYNRFFDASYDATTLCSTAPVISDPITVAQWDELQRILDVDQVLEGLDVSTYNQRVLQHHAMSQWTDMDREHLAKAIYMADVIKHSFAKGVTKCGVSAFQAAARVITLVHRGLIESMPLMAVIGYEAVRDVANPEQLLNHPINKSVSIISTGLMNNYHCYSNHATLGVLPSSEAGLALLGKIGQSMAVTSRVSFDLLSQFKSLYESSSSMLCDLWDGAVREQALPPLDKITSIVPLTVGAGWSQQLVDYFVNTLLGPSVVQQLMDGLDAVVSPKVTR